MSTATRIPTPGDLADRELVSAVRAPAEAFRSLYERGIRESRMLPHCRLVALTLLSLGDDAGLIADDAQPGVGGLSRATGLGSEQVRVALAALRDRGWITRTRVGDGVTPDQRSCQPTIRQYELNRLLGK